jgi:hypothetical protein
LNNIEIAALFSFCAEFSERAKAFTQSLDVLAKHITGMKDTGKNFFNTLQPGGYIPNAPGPIIKRGIIENFTRENIKCE